MVCEVNMQRSTYLVLEKMMHDLRSSLYDAGCTISRLAQGELAGRMTGAVFVHFLVLSRQYVLRADGMAWYLASKAAEKPRILN